MIWAFLVKLDPDLIVVPEVYTLHHSLAVVIYYEIERRTVKENHMDKWFLKYFLICSSRSTHLLQSCKMRSFKNTAANKHILECQCSDSSLKFFRKLIFAFYCNCSETLISVQRIQLRFPVWGQFSDNNRTVLIHYFCCSHITFFRCASFISTWCVPLLFISGHRRLLWLQAGASPASKFSSFLFIQNSHVLDEMPSCHVLSQQLETCREQRGVPVCRETGLLPPVSSPPDVCFSSALWSLFNSSVQD